MKTLLMLTTLWLGGAALVQGALPDPEAPRLSAGDYSAVIMPVLNADMAKRIEERVSEVAGLQKVNARAQDSTIRFSVRENYLVDSADIRRAINSVNPGAVMTTPVLEKAYAATPGL